VDASPTKSFRQNHEFPKGIAPKLTASGSALTLDLNLVRQGVTMVMIEW
jgi:hypothetical protein